MAHRLLVVALGALVAGSPVAAQPDSQPIELATDVATPAPPGGPETEYCLRVAPITGRLAESVECMTRDQWAEQGVDVDKEWAEEGVGVKA